MGIPPLGLDRMAGLDSVGGLQRLGLEGFTVFSYLCNGSSGAGTFVHACISSRIKIAYNSQDIVRNSTQSCMSAAVSVADSV